MDISSFAREGFQDGYVHLPYVLEITPNCFGALSYGLKSPKSEDGSQYTTNCTERNIFPIKPGEPLDMGGIGDPRTVCANGLNSPRISRSLDVSMSQDVPVRNSATSL
jgi:hypothetical protein